MTGPVSEGTARLVRVLEHAGVTVVLDVGANVGQYASRLRRGGYAGRIVSFEPLASAHAALADAAAGDPGWTVAPRAALGDRDGTVTLHVSAASDMSSVRRFTPEMAGLLDSAAFVGAETVPQARLDAAFDRHAGPNDRTLLKLDVQGAERAVLDGAAGVLDRIALIQIELSIVPIYDGEPGWLEMTAYLDRLGFRPVLFLPGYFNRRTARMLQMDGVFAPYPDAGPDAGPA